MVSLVSGAVAVALVGGETDAAVLARRVADRHWVLALVSHEVFSAFACIWSNADPIVETKLFADRCFALIASVTRFITVTIVWRNTNAFVQTGVVTAPVLALIASVTSETTVTLIWGNAVAFVETWRVADRIIALIAFITGSLAIAFVRRSTEPAVQALWVASKKLDFA